MEQNTPVSSSKGLSIAALVCGIIGVVGLFLSAHPVIAVITFVIAILGLVLGAVGMKKAKENNEPRGLAIAGLVLGIVGTALGLIGVICAICVCTAASAINQGISDGSLQDLINQIGG